MNRTLTSIALVGLCILSASAVQAQSVPLAGNGVSTSTMSYAAMPDVARDPKGMVAPQNPTAEEAFVKEKIRGAGYTGVNSLMRDNAGTWHALAYKGPADVDVTYDLAGHIAETPRH